MEKEYLSPETFIVYLKGEDIVTASQGFGPEDKDVTGNDIYNDFEE